MRAVVNAPVYTDVKLPLVREITEHTGSQAPEGIDLAQLPQVHPSHCYAMKMKGNGMQDAKICVY